MQIRKSGGKVLYIRDIDIAGVYYPRIAVSIPSSNASINTDVAFLNISKPSLNGFSQILRIGDFEIVCFADSPTSCPFLSRTEFGKTNWNTFLPKSCVIVDQSLNTSLKNYLTQKEDNILLFVNGYRNIAPYRDLNMNEDFPDSDNIVKLYDYYGPNRNFLGAHYGSSYEWIFKTIINNQAPGYVKPR